MIRNVLAVTIMLPFMAVAQSSQPASSQPSSTAARSMPRYYNLMKNEFMKTEQGIVVLVPDSLKKVIGDMRQRAAEDRQEINEDIAAVTDEIRKADAEQKAHKKTVLAERSRAARHDNQTIQYSAYRSSSGRVTGHVYRDSIEAYRAGSARRNANRAKADAARAKGDVSSAKAELLELKKELASLSWAASPYARNMPPRTFWSDLPEETKKQLARVGITKEDFAAVLKSCKLSDDAFLDAAVKIDKETRTAPDCADRLRDLFEKRMPPVPRVSQSPTMPPPAGAMTPLRTTRTQR